MGMGKAKKQKLNKGTVLFLFLFFKNEFKYLFWFGQNIGNQNLEFNKLACSLGTFPKWVLEKSLIFVSFLAT